MIRARKSHLCSPGVGVGEYCQPPAIGRNTPRRLEAAVGDRDRGRLPIECTETFTGHEQDGQSGV